MRGRPPYSCTRLRTLAPWVTGAATPLSRLNSDIAPPAAGTFSVQYRRPFTLRRSPKLIPPAARASALKGEAQDPYGAVSGAGDVAAGDVLAGDVLAGAAAAGAVLVGAAECDVMASNRAKRMRPARGVAVNAGRAVWLMCGSLGAHRMLGCSDA